MMSKTTSISLGQHFQGFVEQQLSVGRYGSASEVVRAGLRILEEHEAKLETLRAALIKGEKSGIAEDYNLETIQRELDSESV